MFISDEFIFSGGASSQKESEYEYQTILPGIKEFLFMRQFLLTNKRFTPDGIITGKEISLKKNTTLKGVCRHYFNAHKKPLCYEKTFQSEIRPFASIDLSTKFRISDETRKDITFDRNDKRIRTNLFIRYQFRDTLDSNATIHLTLSWMIRDKDLPEHVANRNISSILQVLEDKRAHPLMLISQRKFNQVIEVEFNSEKKATAYKLNYLSLIVPIYMSLASINIIEKIKKELSDTKTDMTIYWPPINKKLTPSPISMSITDYIRDVVPNMDQYCVSPKADGYNMYILISKDTTTDHAFLFNDSEVIMYSHLKRLDDGHIEKIMAERKIIHFADYDFYEAERIGSDIYVYDRTNGVSGDYNYISRIKKQIPNIYLKEKFSLLHTPYKTIEEVLKKTYNFPVDGLIFSNCNIKDSRPPYKHKEDHTVDFMIYANEIRKELWLLSFIERERLEEFSLWREHKYIYESFGVSERYFNTRLVPFKIPILEKGQPPSHLLQADYDRRMHGKIMECSLTPRGWVAIRERTDKEIPNHYKTALLTTLAQRVPLTRKMLLAPKDNIDIFFTQRRIPEYEQQRYYNSQVRKLMIRNHINNGYYVLDIGSGRGNTFFQMRNQNAHQVTMFDQDRAAMLEFIVGIFKTKRDKNTNETRPLLVKGSFTNPDDTAIVPKNPKYDTIFCSFAAHFAFGSRENISTFVNLIIDSSKSGTRVIILDIDGQDLFERLSVSKNKYLQYPEKGQGKFIFKGEYADTNTFQGIDYKIKVKYPFSPEDKLSEEYLTDFRILIQNLEMSGFKTVEFKSFSEYYPEEFAALSKEDQAFVSLHKALVMRRS